MKPFVAMAKGLRERGLSAPDILHADLEQGLLLIEDLGDERVVAGDPPAPIEERYEAAVDVLLALHGRQLPDVLPVAPHVEYRIPPYDMDAFLIEAELLLDWYLPRLRRARHGRRRAPTFQRLWREALQPAIDSPPTWVLRDFHSPNLLWLPERSELARLGMLDFQDALMGPAGLRPRLAAAGRPRRRAGSRWSSRCSAAMCGARRAADPDFDAARVHQDLRHARGAARQQDPRHLRAPRRARRQAAIFASHAARMGLPAAFARASGAGARSMTWYGEHVPALKTL